MSLRRENTAPPRFCGTSSMRQPRSFTPPQQRSHQFARRGSLGVLPYSADKKPLAKRSNSLGCANDDLSPTKLDFRSLKKRPSLLANKLKSGSKDAETASNGGEKHSIVMLGAGVSARQVNSLTYSLNPNISDFKTGRILFFK